MDAGTATNTDSGPPPLIDAGTALPVDGGTLLPVDSGTSAPIDSGTPTPVDSGTTNPDAGPTNPDAGIPTPDAGTAPVDAGPPAPVDVNFHLIGQSNAMGRAYLPSDRTNMNGMMLPDGTQVTEANTVQDFPDRYGIEIILAETWLGVFPTLLKTAQGGISSAGYIIELLPQHVALVASQPNADASDNVLLWIQGESDARNLVMESTYKSQEMQIFNAIRAEVPNLQVYSVLLSENMPPLFEAGREAINNAKIANASENAWIHTIGNTYAFGMDGLHYDGPGFEQMATEFIAAQAN